MLAVLALHIAVIGWVGRRVPSPHPHPAPDTSRRMVYITLPARAENKARPSETSTQGPTAPTEVTREHAIPASTRAPAPRATKAPATATPEPALTAGDRQAVRERDGAGDEVAPLRGEGSKEQPAATPDLDLGSGVMKQATQGSKGAVSQMAERSHAGSLINDAPSASQRLSGQMEHAAIPDCLREDALKHSAVPLGGLLAIPSLVHAAMSGSCKTP
ncbi:hypothetical protein OOT46_00660 [Aquabacterium sp. A7-Y]|uniref:hypothetical protein n=1 Tax=Aquabacterium sp. A7-Y TaxID=1349605 RepID=UPI00223DE6BE|nr:hypothetical protein [Aquabacterium sp. A7-Y]MCW7536364.1 hypothetical protein [Aquabacterium sp. A7-Y]